MPTVSHVWTGIVCALCLSIAAGCSPPDTQSPQQVTELTITDAPSESELAAAVENPAAFRIVMLGDSLTAGFGLPQSAALPEQVEALINSETRPVEIINAGVSGDTSAGGLARYDWSVSAADPDMLILALGANDYLGGLNPALTRDNLTAILDRARADGLLVLLVGLSTRSSDSDDPLAAQFGAIYPELATVYDVPLHPGLLSPIFDQPKYLLPDGLHPNAEGIKIIAKPLAETVRSLLPDG